MKYRRQHMRQYDCFCGTVNSGSWQDLSEGEIVDLDSYEISRVLQYNLSNFIYSINKSDFWTSTVEVDKF
jgi:hypothetical protein